ncbi:MAG: Azospirillum phage Cd [Pseudomonadota bacterium]
MTRPAARPAARPNKFHARKTVVDGITFDSAAEARRWADLLLLERAGQISNLERQVDFPCVVNGAKVCVYRADFVYFEGPARVVEDVKGHRTREYLLKKKLVEAVYPGVRITEITRGRR